MVGGLYTLNCCCESVVVVAAGAGGGGDGVGSGTAAAAAAAAVDVVVGVAADGSVLEDASGAFGAVDAFVGGDVVAALGVDIGPRTGSGSGTSVALSYYLLGPNPTGPRTHISELVAFFSLPHTYL
jgi:hypothetical protein